MWQSCPFNFHYTHLHRSAFASSDASAWRSAPFSCALSQCLNASSQSHSEKLAISRKGFLLDLDRKGFSLDLDRLACVRIPTQIQIKITPWEFTFTHSFTRFGSRWTISFSQGRTVIFAHTSQKRSKIDFLTTIQIKQTMSSSLSPRWEEHMI